MLIIIEALFWIQKIRNDVLFNNVVSSHKFSWYDTTLICVNNVDHCVEQKIWLETEHL
jgi:hypothetical protein